jgi:hypothetical protein
MTKPLAKVAREVIVVVKAARVLIGQVGRLKRNSVINELTEHEPLSHIFAGHSTLSSAL